MLQLCTGKPGASKSLNTLAFIVSQNNGDRPIYYHNVRLLMLDYRVASSFSGWFYGNYLLKLKNKGAIKRLNKIIKRVHADDEFVQLSHVPWLQSLYEASNPLDTWLYWVRKLYNKNQLEEMEEFISNMPSDSLTFESLIQFNLHFIHFDNAIDWYKLPKTSIIFIDECQNYFPPRSAGSVVPPYISNFETHRHHGFDVYLVTQDRMLLDSNVRRLVNRHVHYHNPFGGDRVTRYEQSKSFDVDNYFDLQSSQRSFIKRPVNFYGSYFSSEMHTHKFKMPRFVYYFAILFILLSICVYLFLSLDVFSSKSVESKAESKVESEKDNSKSISKVSLKPISSSLLNDAEKSSLISFVDKSIEGVFISGSQYIKRDTGLVTFDYSFYKPSTDEIFYPDSLGFVLQPISPCLVRLTLHDFTTFITCNPFNKIEQNQPTELVAAS